MAKGDDGGDGEKRCDDELGAVVAENCLLEMGGVVQYLLPILAHEVGDDVAAVARNDGGEGGSGDVGAGAGGDEAVRVVGADGVDMEGEGGGLQEVEAAAGVA